MMDTAPFKELIKEKAGICFDKSGSDFLSHEIQNMMSGRGLKSPLAYYDLLVRDPEEFFRFLNLLTVNETYFFREPVHLRLFSEKLIPELLGNRAEREKIRILSAGCSTGEEPYSLAIVLHQKYGPDAQKFFSVTGADIDTQAIKKAGEGIYTARAFRSADPVLKTAYFKDLGNSRFQISETVRMQVCFHILNLLSFPYPEPLRGNDIVFYRNVSIYFESTARKKIFRHLADTLNPGGYLIVSSTETLSHDYKILNLIERDGVFLFCKSADRGEQHNIPSFSATVPVSAGRKRDKSGSITEPLKLPASSALPMIPGSQIFDHSGSSSGSSLAVQRISQSHRSDAPELKKKQDGEPEQLYLKALALAQGKAYAEALDLLDRGIRTYPSFIRAKTLHAEILFNSRQPDAAARICTEVLQDTPLCLEACLLLGLIAKSREQPEEALKRFRQAIYIRSSAWLAHFHTAEICRSKGENEKSVREYEIVIRLIIGGGFGDHGLSFFPFSFSEADILHLCRHNMEKIRNSNPLGCAKEKSGGI
ncbi:MAG: CheR family methyltransferase [Desulfococcaceae bacterium]